MRLYCWDLEEVCGCASVYIRVQITRKYIQVHIQMMSNQFIGTCKKGTVYVYYYTHIYVCMYAGDVYYRAHVIPLIHAGLL